MSGTLTVGPRLEFNPDGYVSLRAAADNREFRLYLHRLTAYAHGDLDGLDDHREVHHRDGDRWNNSPDNLEALEPRDHRRAHQVGL